MTQPIRSSLQGTLHECSGACGVMEPGHGVSVMQARLASATPSKWVDAVVVAVSAAGWIEVASFANGSSEIVWNHADLTDSVAVGDPVALHPVYDVLAVGGAKHSVLRTQSFN